MSAARFVTSLDERLFEASGRRLLESFAEHNPQLPLAVYAEAATPARFDLLRAEVESLGARCVDLAGLPLLAEFSRRCRDVIPRCYGGDAPDEDFPGSGPESGDAWFRRGMARWFRKWVALDHAVTGARAGLFWIDCDCAARAPLPDALLEGLLADRDYCHLKGSRPVSETGFFGFDNSEGRAARFLEAVRRYYLEREFEAHPRWDDSYAFDWIAGCLAGLRGRDLAGEVDPAFGEVMPGSILGPYIAHEKGLHGRVLRLHR